MRPNFFADAPRPPASLKICLISYDVFPFLSSSPPNTQWHGMKSDTSSFSSNDWASYHNTCDLTGEDSASCLCWHNCLYNHLLRFAFLFSVYGARAYFRTFSEHIFTAMLVHLTSILLAYFTRPPEAPIYLCPENSGFEASKIENLCPEIADLRPEKSDLCPGHSGF